MPLFIHVPESLIAEHPLWRDALLWNSKRIVGNIDIYPTLLEIVKSQSSSEIATGLAVDQGYAGRSLLSPVPDNRYILSLNTGEIRQWSRAGFAVYRGFLKLRVEARTGAQLYNLASDPGETLNLSTQIQDDDAAAFNSFLRGHPLVQKVLFVDDPVFLKKIGTRSKKL